MDTQSLAITQHAGHSQLQALESWLAKTKDAATEAPETAAEWVRLKRVLDLVMQRLDSSDPSLIPSQIMEGISQSVGNIVGQVSTFASNQSTAYLQQANKYANDLLYHALLLPGTEFKKARKSLVSYMEDYAKAIAQHTTELKEQTKDGLQSIATLKSQVAALQSQVELQKAAAISLSEAQTNAFKDAQDARELAFGASEEARKKAFEAAESLRKESLAENLNGHSESVSDFLARKGNEADQHLEVSKSQAHELISLLEGFKDQAEELVGLTGTLTRANAYREAAKSENRRAWIWSVVAAAALISLSVVAFRTLWTYTNGAHPAGVDWSGFSIRLYTLFALTGLAFYAGRQGEIHRNAERQNRRLFADLASVSPFLSDLDPEKREAIIEEIARRIFGQPEPHVEPMRQSPLLTPEQIGKVVDVITELAGKASKKL